MHSRLLRLLTRNSAILKQTSSSVWSVVVSVPSNAQLAQLFESAETVEMVKVIYDKVTGRSRGFGFVTMSTAAEVEAAAQ
ncbi:unnamed protein product [Eruca vesicaria subsp. sativa]|uniref:RRM domain-containing protein n=1 Tax=Eruca vesicaria subsp. sativa TaxID=29727 RepID=A0ABC8JWK0_ERUVS|nr:unnamed protein product [Eruca vesicaria subsp. sativa]